MKIGFLIKSFDALANWELRIIDRIRRDPDMEIALLVQDGRPSDDGLIAKLTQSKNLAGRIALSAQTALEKRLFKPAWTVDREDLIRFLETLPCIKLSPTKKRAVDLFSEEDARAIQKYDLDVLLRHAFNIIRGPIFESAKYGVWSFHHGDNRAIRGMPAGFWEPVLGEANVGVTLQQLTSELDGGRVIGRGTYNVHWSCIKNRNLVFEHSVSILFKHLEELKRGVFQTEASGTYDQPLYSKPSLGVVLRYCWRFYSSVLRKAKEKLCTSLFKTRHSCWTLFIGKGQFMEAPLFRLKPVQMPDTEFWADPFLVTRGDERYVFFENYLCAEKRGKISVGRVQKGQLVEVQDVLDLEYHLSYPNVFEEDGEMYMIPETHKNNRVEIYRCTEFPAKWELYATAFEGESIVDTTYYRDEHGDRWLFLNKGFGNDPCAELYIYKIDSLQLKTIQPHQQNPVLIDSRVARNAGPIFHHDGKTLRPSQISANDIYGCGLNINEIVTLDLEEYREQTIRQVFPQFKEGLHAMHHLHQTCDTFVIDAAYEKK